VAADLLEAPPHAVPGVEVGCERRGAYVLACVVEGHESHDLIIYRQCGGGGQGHNHCVDASARPMDGKILASKGLCGKFDKSEATRISGLASAGKAIGSFCNQ